MREQILVASSNSRLVNQIQLLAGGRYNVRQVTSRREAIDAAVRNDPVLCIVDAETPGMDGYELCGILKEEYDRDHLCFMLLTKGDVALDKGRAELVRLDCSMSLPLDKQEFMEKIAYLSRKGADLLKAKTVGDGLGHQIHHAIDMETGQLVEDEPALFVSTAEQYSEIKSMDLPPGRSIQHSGVAEQGDSLFYHGADNLGGGRETEEDEGEEEIPLIVSQGFDSSHPDDPPALSPVFRNPDTEFLESSLLETNPAKPPGVGNTVTADWEFAEVPGLSDDRIERMAAEAIERKLAHLTDERINQIVVETVEERLQKALSILSPKIHKTIRQTVEKELEARLGAEIDVALAKQERKPD